MTKQELWQSVYIEAMRQGRMNKPKELADKAVEEFEERFEDYLGFDKVKYKPDDVNEAYMIRCILKRLNIKFSHLSMQKVLADDIIIEFNGVTNQVSSITRQT